MTDRELMQQALEALESSDESGCDEFMSIIDALRERLAQPVQGGKTGWPAGMLQDDSRELSKALASKPDAKRHAREAAQLVAQPEQEPVFDCPRCGHCCSLPDPMPLFDDWGKGWK